MLRQLLWLERPAAVNALLQRLSVVLLERELVVHLDVLVSQIVLFQNLHHLGIHLRHWLLLLIGLQTLLLLELLLAGP